MRVLVTTGRPQSCQWDRRPRSGIGKQPLEILRASLKPHEEIGDVATLADISRELDDLRVRNHSRDPQCTFAACLIAVEAEVDAGNIRELFGPFGTKRSGAAS